MLSILPLPHEASLAEPVVLAATWFGAGLIEPLRAGLAVATALPFAIWLAAGGRPALLVALASIFLAGAWAAFAWEAGFDVKDDRRIVIDEVAGFLACLLVIGRTAWPVAAASAALFLAIDRWKPWPLGVIEQWPGGWGVMADDVAAGLLVGIAVSACLGIARRGLR